MRQYQRATLAMISAPLFLFLAAIVGLHFWGPPTSYESGRLLFILNSVFTTLVSLFIAFLAARSFLVHGRQAVLMLCVAMIVWGFTALLATMGQHVGNYNMTIHNLGVAVSGLFHLAGALVALRDGGRAVRASGAWLAGGLSSGFIAVGILWSSALEEWLPPFFVEGVGGTELRFFVLSFTVGTFASAAVLTWLQYRSSSWRFLLWYSLGLALIAIGLAGLSLQPTHGSLLGWVARSAQYLASVYMLVGTILTIRQSGRWELSLEEELQRSEQAQRDQAQLLDLAHDAIVVRFMEGTITYWNSGASRLYGWTNDEALGRSVVDLLKPEFPKPLDQIEADLRNQGWWEGDLRHKRRDGELLIVRSRWAVRASGAYGPEMVLEINRDITEQVRAEASVRASEERLRTLADSAPVLMWQTDATGVVFVNRHYVDFFGVPFAKLAGSGWADFVHPDDRNACVAVYETARDRQEGFERQFRFRRADGLYRWLRSVGSPHRDATGNFLGFIGCSADITENKLAEEALREADRRKDDFLALLAHELRGPLAPLRNMIEVMKRTDSTPEALRGARDIMDRQLIQLTRLVDDLIDVSRITRDRIELRKQPVSIASLIQQSVETCRPLAERMHHRITVAPSTEPIYVYADPVRLAQVFGNILNNACKYTEPGGDIQLIIERDGGDVLVRVKDSGLGIAPDQLDRVFEMFIQIDPSLERAQGGLGIGLSLVKRLVEMHGGAVTAHSEGPGKGAEFTVRLPAHEPQALHAAPSPSPAVAASRRRVLVVDDNPDGTSSLATLLALTGHDTQTAHDGLQALQVAETYRPDVVLLDIGLPGLNGYDVCRQLRRQPWGRSALVIALTGWGQEEDRRKSKEAGFDHHLVKPVDYDALMQILAAKAA